MNYLSKTLSLTLFMVSGILYSGACDDYPYSHGDVDILVNTEDEIKILASAEEEVLFNDLDLRIEAQEMAEAAAKVRIIRFLEEEIGESCQSNKTQSSTVKFSSDDPENKEVDVVKTKERLCTISTNTRGLLRGVLPVDGCTQVSDQPLKVIVTVGLKSENILAAERTAGQINDSINRTNTPKGELCSKDPENPEECIVSEESESKGMSLNKDKDKKGGEGIKKF